MSEGHPSRMRGQPRRLNARGLTAGVVSVAATTACLATAGAVQAAPSLAPAGAAGIVPSGSVRIGTLPSSTTLHIDVVLSPRDPQALSQYATDVATPGSPLYRDYIARGQFASMFGPTSATINSVYAALRARGLRPGAISGNHLSIPVSAPAGQIESAFGVGMASYHLAGGGTGFANTSAPKLPASVASSIQTIIGLDNLTKMHPLALASIRASTKLTRTHAIRPAGEPTGGPQPCQSAAAAQGTGGLTADELAFSYDFSPLYAEHDFGHGITVGIVEFGEPNSPSDISTYQSCYGTDTKISYTHVDGFHRRGPGQGEAALDIETVLSAAPGAHITVYQAPNNRAGTYDDYRVIVEQDQARVISESYGLCEHYQNRRDANADTTLFEQAAAQGQTIVASSGDSGSEACVPSEVAPKLNRLNVNFPASDPFVLGVGGTIVTSVAQPPAEAVWNERGATPRPLGATGGGKSGFYREPGWQRRFGIRAKSREVPDVAADADPSTGYVMFQNGLWQQIGGTSGAAPLWAAFLALTDNRCPATPVGFVNPTMYFVARKSSGLHDIVPVQGRLNNNDYTGQGHRHYQVFRGYDMATGLGTPIGDVLAHNLCRFGAAKHGYFLVTASGHVDAFRVPSHGSVSRPGSRVVGIATSARDGYWVATAKGHVFAFHAPRRGSAHTRSPIVGIAPNKAGNGYWLVSASGHVFAFGARNFGSVRNPGSRVVGIALDPQTGGYWVVTAKGKVFAFHAGRYRGRRLSNVTGIASDPKRQGYWLVTASGRVFAFHVPNFGSMPFRRVGKVIGIAGDPTSGGYYLVTGDGHVVAINAKWHGDNPRTSKAITGIAIAH